MKVLQNKKTIYSWIWVILYSIIIFLTVPVALKIQRFVAKYLGKNAFIYFVLSIVGLAFLFLLYFLILKLKARTPSRYIWLFILTGFYSYFVLNLAKSPAEAIHFLEYGLLGYFLFRALNHNIKDKSIYFTAALFCLLVGTIDEILQWITPNRFWSFHDVWINSLSGGLLLLGLWNVIKPEEISEKINPKSIRVLSSISVVCILVLGLCASNTPNTAAYYTNLIPRLSPLQQEEAMSDYGYKLKDPEIGIFYSRFSPKELKDTDKQKGEEYARELNKSVKIEYKQFLRKYNTITNPFLNELRNHVFCRNTNFNKAKNTSDLKEKRVYYLVSYKENLILEKHFGNTVRRSAYVWSKDKIMEVERLIDRNKPYKSPVSLNLITAFSQKTLWIAISVFISLIVAINLILHLKER